MNLGEIKLKKQSWNLLLVVVFFVEFWGFSSSANADWQGELEAAFSDAKVVETFDGLEDWYGEAMTGYIYSNSTPTAMPTKTAGGYGPWTSFTTDHKAIQVSAPSTFAKGNTITGNTSGVIGYVSSVQSIDGGHWLVLNKNSANAKFTFGETVTNGAGASATFIGYAKWIGDHGTNYDWRGVGKSLVINYNDFTKNYNDSTGVGEIDSYNPDNIAGFGPTRLETFFGDGVTGKSGLKKLHLFMMVKFSPAFFAPCTEESHPANSCSGTTGYKSVGTLKMFDICSGFENPQFWGTAEEQAQLNEGSFRYANLTTSYGPNMSIVDIRGGGLSYPSTLYYYESPFIAQNTANGVDYLDLPTQDFLGSGLNLASMYESDSWFGMEFVSDVGTVDSVDGTTDFWLYDSNGNELGHFAATEETRMAIFDHYYNKVSIGGNRLCRGYGTCPSGQDNRWYVDDIIVNGSQIAPTYFEALANYSESDAVPPASPSGLSVL